MSPLPTPRSGPATLPIRDGSRDGATPTGPPRRCPVCPTPLPSARARYCSPACKQHAFRLRHQAAPAPDDTRLRDDLRRRGRLAAHTIYECPACGERRLGERRCPDCQLFSRALGLGGHCPECEHPILLTELLGTEVMR